MSQRDLFSFPSPKPSSTPSSAEPTWQGDVEQASGCWGGQRSGSAATCGHRWASGAAACPEPAHLPTLDLTKNSLHPDGLLNTRLRPQSPAGVRHPHATSPSSHCHHSSCIPT